jgi:drug/metabolite transporter (DMT)-like permease
MVLGAWGILVGVVGVGLLVGSVVLGRRWGFRRSVGVAGAGLLLVGLALSGVVNIVVQAIAIGLNPVRWVGLGAAGAGVLMLFWSGLLQRRRADVADGPERARSVPGDKQRPAVERGGRPAHGDDDLAEIEEILRRRGIE